MERVQGELALTPFATFGSKATGGPSEDFEDEFRARDRGCRRTLIEVFVYPKARTDHLMRIARLLLILTRGSGPISLNVLLGSLTRARA